MFGQELFRLSFLDYRKLSLLLNHCTLGLNHVGRYHIRSFKPLWLINVLVCPIPSYSVFGNANMTQKVRKALKSDLDWVTHESVQP